VELLDSQNNTGEKHNACITSKCLDETFKILADSPTIGYACDYIEPGLRKYPFQSHVVFFDCLSDEEILMVRMLHKNMDVHQAVFLA
jgi:toxin ParE1/3/4